MVQTMENTKDVSGMCVTACVGVSTRKESVKRWLISGLSYHVAKVVGAGRVLVPFRSMHLRYREAEKSKKTLY